MARNAIRWFASSFDVQAATSFRNCTCVPRTRPYHLIISSRRLVFIVTWWSEGLMLVVELVVMALSLSPQSPWVATDFGSSRRARGREGDTAGTNLRVDAHFALQCPKNRTVPISCRTSTT